ncbi:hypothetical protein PYH66_03430 [Staphylococcus delphini]
MSDQSIRQIKKLNQGEAILTSINLIRDIQIEIIKSNRINANSTPTL